MAHSNQLPGQWGTVRDTFGKFNNLAVRRLKLGSGAWLSLVNKVVVQRAKPECVQFSTRLAVTTLSVEVYYRGS